MRTCNRIFLALFGVVVLSFGGITVHRTWKVGYNHLAAPHDLVLERPALGTISILQQGLWPAPGLDDTRLS